MQLKKCLAVLLILASLLSATPALAAYNMPYYVDVDLTNQIVTIYNTSDNSIHRQMLCSAGTGDKTPTGTYYMPNKDRDDERTEWYWMPNARTWVKYPTKIYYAYFFHSIPFNRQDDSTMNQKAIADFGNPASHGCIRMRVEDAEYIARNCGVGTRVRIYRSGERNENLRTLLYVSSFTGEDGMTYQEFLGYSENDLGLGCSGSEVTDLQHRLNDLGYYDGPYDGVYSNELVGVVKRLQQDLGLLETGISTSSLLEVIYSDDAPVSTGEIAITDGSSGPVVKKLQQALEKLGLYTGPIDSVYDVEVAEAVKNFQTVCGINPDGVATSETQHTVYYVVNQLDAAMGGENYSMEYANEELTTGLIDSERANIILRAQPSTDSSSLGKLVHGDKVTVVALEGDWAHIISASGAGYILKKYLSSPGTTYNYIVNFTSDSGKTYTLGNTMENRLAGGKKIVDEARDYYSSAEFSDYLDDADVTFATVNTGSDGLQLNLRAEASAEAEILAQIDNGVSMRVLENGDAWTKVAYLGSIGYLMTDYLSIWQGKDEDDDDVLSTQKSPIYLESGERIPATVITPTEAGRANIYAEADEDSEILAKAPSQFKLDIVSFNEETGWVLVEHEGNQGYMRDENLHFTLGPQ